MRRAATPWGEIAGQSGEHPTGVRQHLATCTRPGHRGSAHRTGRTGDYGCDSIPIAGKGRHGTGMTWTKRLKQPARWSCRRTGGRMAYETRPATTGPLRVQKATRLALVRHHVLKGTLMMRRMTDTRNYVAFKECWTPTSQEMRNCRNMTKYATFGTTWTHMGFRAPTFRPIRIPMGLPEPLSIP